MQCLKLNDDKNCRKKPKARNVVMTIRDDIVKLFDRTMGERGEKNRSGVVEGMMICYIYSTEDGECKPTCPYYEEEKDVK